MPAQLVRTELHISIIQDVVIDRLNIQIDSKVLGAEATSSSAVIGTDQLFVRLQDILNSHVRVVCNQMEKQIKEQRKTK